MTLGDDDCSPALAKSVLCYPQSCFEDSMIGMKESDCAKKKMVTIDSLRRAIPAHCFHVDFATGPLYFARDVFFAFTLGWVAWTYIPLIRCEGRLEFEVARYAVWLLYGYIQGLVFTGIWVLGHEAGHGVLSSSSILTNTIGFLCHSALLIPYFSWQSTHRRHHLYANNLAKDNGFVPSKTDQFAQDLVEDAPVVTLLRILIQQLFGFPAYLLSNVTASKGATYRPKSSVPLGNSHFLPFSTLFRPREAYLILASDFGILVMLVSLYTFGQEHSFTAVTFLYMQGYIWCNHWIVAITYLHHTHPNLPKYDPKAWTFLRGGLATMDRSLGWVGKHLLHNIADYHIVHHLFSRIPQYHTEEATKAIIPLLGEAYL